VVTTSSYPTEHNTLVRYLEQLKNPFPHSSVIFRKQAVSESGGYNERFIRVQDYELWLHVSERYTIASCSEPLSSIRFRSNSVAHSAGSIEQFKFTLLGYILHKRRLIGSDKIMNGEWESYFNTYERWYYEKIVPNLSDLWSPKMKFAYALQSKRFIECGIHIAQIFRESFKRILSPNKSTFLSMIPDELLDRKYSKAK